MTTAIWRIAAETPSYRACEMNGAGAKKTGGRWNSPDLAVLSCSSSITLSVLETLSYLNAMSLPFHRFLVRMALPDRIWTKPKEPTPPPGRWDAVPAGLASRMAGDECVRQGESALLVVPSAIIPEESNILINPAHADSAEIAATTLRRWIYDPRLFTA